MSSLKYLGIILLLSFAFTYFGINNAEAQNKDASTNVLCRYPTLYGNEIVFEAGGNLWRVNRNGGIADRLTTDKGFDLMPRFSPDGKTIAFTGDYDGNIDVYIIPAKGGNSYKINLSFRHYKRCRFTLGTG